MDVALEQARGALFYALSKYQHLVLYPVHPSTSYAYRKAVHPSGTKDDPKDAVILLDLLTMHRDHLRVLQPDTEPMRKLQALVEQRRQMVDERTAQTNRMTQQLKLYFPQVLEWFDDLTAPIVAAFLKRWPTLAKLQKEAPDTLRAFFHEQGSRSAARINERLQQIQAAKAPVSDAAVIEPAVLAVETALVVVAALNNGIRKLEKPIEEVSTSPPEYAIFSSFPAAGPVMAPRLMALWLAQGALWERCRIAIVQWHRAGDAGQRTAVLDPLPLGLSQIPAADLPRVRRSVAATLRLGQRLLRPTEGQRQRPPRRGPELGL